MICFIYVEYYYLFYLYQETDDNQKVNSDRKSLADGIVDLLISAVPFLQVSDLSQCGLLYSLNLLLLLSMLLPRICLLSLTLSLFPL